jgi:hypothetical protein
LFQSSTQNFGEMLWWWWCTKKQLMNSG